MPFVLVSDLYVSETDNEQLNGLAKPVLSRIGLLTDKFFVEFFPFPKLDIYHPIFKNKVNTFEAVF